VCQKFLRPSLLRLAWVLESMELRLHLEDILSDVSTMPAPERIDALNDLARELRRQDSSRALELAEEALALARLQQRRSVQPARQSLVSS
jgi:hypothetical protein